MLSVHRTTYATVEVMARRGTENVSEMDIAFANGTELEPQARTLMLSYHAGFVTTMVAYVQVLASTNKLEVCGARILAILNTHLMNDCCLHTHTWSDRRIM